MIYQGAKNIAKNLISPDGTIGIRLVQDPFCQKLIKKLGKPLVSTSSNISGYPTPKLFSDIDIKIKRGVDYVVQHRQEDTTPTEPSTVIKVNEDGSFNVLRN